MQTDPTARVTIGISMLARVMKREWRRDPRFLQNADR
jgi:hypothetical protein